MQVGNSHPGGSSSNANVYAELLQTLEYIMQRAELPYEELLVGTKG